MRLQIYGFLLSLLLTLPLHAISQNTVLIGKVVDIHNEPLIGVNVVQKGTTNGTITDLEGEFSFEAAPNATIVFSYIGFRTEEVDRNGKASINITLHEDSELLDELVVVGYGTLQKKDITGAISTVDGDQVSKIRGTQLSQSLQGLLPGVTVTRSSSLPGAGADIVVRGVTTISDNNPLIVVDGVPFSSINDINANDIEDITVLKDAASASIYGARAAAGVILITTKQASEGQTRLEAGVNFGIETAATFPSVVGVRRYLEMANEIMWNDAGNPEGAEYPLFSKDDVENWEEYNKTNPNNYPITDWVKLLVNKTAPSQRHYVTFSHADKKINSRTSFNYENTDALYDYRSYQRIIGRTNNRINFGDKLAVGADASFNHSASLNPTSNPLASAYRHAPIYAATWSDGRIAGGKDGSNMYADLHHGGFNNSWYNKLNAKISLEYAPIEDLTITGTLSPYLLFDKNKHFIKQIPWYSAEDPTALGGYINGHNKTNLSEERIEEFSLTKQLVLNYVKKANGHNLNLMGGYEDFYYKMERLTAGSDDFELSGFPYLDLGNTNFLSNSGNAVESAYRSFFGRLVYDYNKKYYVQANVRYDGSSRFHPDHRWALFPSVSTGWAISEEPFMQQIDWLSLLKVRASYGSLGNERIGYYPYQSTITFSSAPFYQGDNIVSKTTAAQVAYAVEDISWETTTSWNVGVDASFLNSRLSFTGDYYVKKTKDMLLELEIPDYLGYGNPDQNAGFMNTRGWEVMLSWNDRITSDLRYSASFNLSNYISKLGDLNGTVFMGDKIIREGSEYNEWFGYISEGLFQTQEEVDNAPLLHSAVKPGDIKYKDISGADGVPDGKITPEYDKVLLGGSLPKLTYGGNLNVYYKNFDFSLTVQGVGKQTSRITADMIQPFISWWTNPSSLLEGNYWSVYNSQEENLKATYPRLSYQSGSNNNYEMSDYWLLNGSYFRLKNIMVGYSFSNARIYASASDLFSISNFPTGWDPEAAANSYITSSFNIGLNLTF